jgi:hypothetical protein
LTLFPQIVVDRAPRIGHHFFTGPHFSLTYNFSSGSIEFRISGNMRVNNQRDRVMGRTLLMCHFIVFKTKHFALYILLVRDWIHTQWIRHYDILLTICTSGFVRAVLTLTEYILKHLPRHFAEEVSFPLFSFDPPERTMLFNFLSLLNKCFITGIVRLEHVWHHSMAGRCL